MNNHDDSGWQSPSDDSADRESPRPQDDAPRFGAYGSPPPGRDDAGYPAPPTPAGADCAR